MADNSAMDTLKGLLGDNADQKIQAVMSSLSGSCASSDSDTDSASVPAVSNPAPISTAGLDQILKIREIIDEMGRTNNDSRSNLLLSLKPFLRSGRQRSVDSAVRLLNLTKLTSLIKR